MDSMESVLVSALEERYWSLSLKCNSTPISYVQGSFVDETERSLDCLRLLLRADCDPWSDTPMLHEASIGEGKNIVCFIVLP